MESPIRMTGAAVSRNDAPSLRNSGTSQNILQLESVVQY